MDTQERLQKVDNHLRRAESLAETASDDKLLDSTRRHMMFAAELRVQIARAYLHSIEVRHM